MKLGVALALRTASQLCQRRLLYRALRRSPSLCLRWYRRSLRNQAVNSTRRAKDIMHGVNLMPSPFALTTLSSLKKILNN